MFEPPRWGWYDNELYPRLPLETEEIIRYLNKRKQAFATVSTTSDNAQPQSVPCKNETWWIQVNDKSKLIQVLIIDLTPKTAMIRTIGADIGNINGRYQRDTINFVERCAEDME